VSAHGYGVLDGFREKEVEYGASDECRGKMRGKIMMNEQLPTHKEEREIVDEPHDDKKARRVPQAVDNGCQSPQ